MATARKLPSGNWRIQCFDGYKPDGKRNYVSFTGTSKREAELRAAQYMADVNRRKKESLTVADAIERYISAKEGVLSPSSIRGYKQMQRCYYDGIADMDVHRLTTEDLQKYVSSLAGTVSAKTVSNVYGLLTSALGMFRPDSVFRVSLPKRVKPKKHAPSDQDVRKLFELADDRTKVCIALAAYGSMRRGEVCALKYCDVSGNYIHIHADMVANAENKFVYKEIPKTSDSVRTVKLPAEVIGLLGSGKPDEFIIKCTPNCVTNQFQRLRNKLNLSIRFHDLRSYYASIGAVLGVPDAYMSDFGGWRKGSSVLKEVYQNVIEDERNKYQEVMTAHFSKIMQHEMQHGNEKTP